MSLSYRGCQLLLPALIEAHKADNNMIPIQCGTSLAVYRLSTLADRRIESPTLTGLNRMMRGIARQ